MKNLGKLIYSVVVIIGSPLIALGVACVMFIDWKHNFFKSNF